MNPILDFRLLPEIRGRPRLGMGGDGDERFEVGAKRRNSTISGKVGTLET